MPPAPTTPGQGTSVIPTHALDATKRAADNGDADAQYSLGVMYRNGVPQDMVEVYVLFSVATPGGVVVAATKQDLAVSKLTPEQLTQAKKGATAYF